MRIMQPKSQLELALAKQYMELRKDYTKLKKDYEKLEREREPKSSLVVATPVSVIRDGRLSIYKLGNDDLPVVQEEVNDFAKLLSLALKAKLKTVFVSSEKKKKKGK
jgi:hypothetical protein